ncbi:hypothetical protein OHJ21_09290 [Virgibacillus sp. LDC1]|nr:hypothetical protein [Virgibacillus sp. LDC1]
MAVGGPFSYPMRHHLGRETFLAPVTWTADGWPSIGIEGRVEQEMDKPQLPELRWPAKPIRDNFDEGSLGLDWVFLRNPLQESWSLHERPGYLVLRGHPSSLHDAGSPAFVGRRLCHFPAIYPLPWTMSLYTRERKRD